MKIRPTGDELFNAARETGVRTDGQIDMTKLIVDFRIFANAPENDKFILDLKSYKLVKQTVNEAL